ncbi:MAG TPA: M3 family metallopeptidase [Candidatus Babeliales bacterium]|nr:M3 family metallopeptidase [Candidatus Babeliales bacterium]
MKHITLLGFCVAAVAQMTVLQGATDMMHRVKSREDIAALFPQTAQEFNERIMDVQQQAQQALDVIIQIPDEQRTFENTVAAFDYIIGASDFAIHLWIAKVLMLVAADDELREAAKAAARALEEFKVVQISDNVDLCRALQTYDASNNRGETTAEQDYYLKECLADFKRAGHDLSAEERAQIVQLKKELVELCQRFSSAIASDASRIYVTQEQLAGLSDDFIANVKRDDVGRCIIGVDYPTYGNVMQNCTIADTRKQLYTAFNNRAYPENEQTLQQMIAKRDQLAKLLGFASYAHLILDNAMIKTPERAQQFLDELMIRATKKAEQEFAARVSDLPESVTLTTDGKMQPWDSGFVLNQYKKTHLAVDEQEIADYFPMEQTIEGLLDVYRQFLGLEFVSASISGLWHEEVRLVEMYESPERKKLLGYLLLDLFPRPNKYSHACMETLIPAVISKSGQDTPAIAVVVANFTRPTADKPSLLSRWFVSTFFHEFGHAIHDLLGRTELAVCAGTHVKLDFVEMPSKMLEEWLWDAEILRKVSCHYKTGEPLPYESIEKIQQLKNFNSGFFVLFQTLGSQLSLDYFAAGADKDVQEISHTLNGRILPMFMDVEQDHHYASFSHLTEYGPQYYGYLLAGVFAYDLFEQIKKGGLLNSKIGKKYIKEILQPGGSKDPNELLFNFLGREPNSDAFFRNLGI